MAHFIRYNALLVFLLTGLTLHAKEAPKTQPAVSPTAAPAKSPVAIKSFACKPKDSLSSIRRGELKPYMLRQEKEPALACSFSLQVLADSVPSYDYYVKICHYNPFKNTCIDSPSAAHFGVGAAVTKTDASSIFVEFEIPSSKGFYQRGLGSFQLTLNLEEDIHTLWGKKDAVVSYLAMFRSPDSGWKPHATGNKKPSEQPLVAQKTADTSPAVAPIPVPLPAQQPPAEPPKDISPPAPTPAPQPPVTPVLFSGPSVGSAQGRSEGPPAQRETEPAKPIEAQQERQKPEEGNAPSAEVPPAPAEKKPGEQKPTSPTATAAEAVQPPQEVAKPAEPIKVPETAAAAPTKTPETPSPSAGEETPAQAEPSKPAEETPPSTEPGTTSGRPSEPTKPPESGKPAESSGPSDKEESPQKPTKPAPPKEAPGIVSA